MKLDTRPLLMDGRSPQGGDHMYIGIGGLILVIVILYLILH